MRDNLLLPVRPGHRRFPTGLAAIAIAAITVLTMAAYPRPSAIDVDPAITVRQNPRTELAADVAPEKGLQVKTILAARAISAQFPQVRNIGGVRPDGLKWHPDGLALDVMIPDYRSPDGVALGDRVVEYVRANANHFALNHLIWRQVLYLPNGTVRKMANRGSDDANHFTHVHIATNGGGYPSGHETYFTTLSGGPAVAENPVDPVIMR